MHFWDTEKNEDPNELSFRPKGYELKNIRAEHDLHSAVLGKDIICTDSLPKENLPRFKDYQITAEIMSKANEGAVVNPCPPFYRGVEVSEDVINSKYFVGYQFKQYLLEVQQAVLIYCLTEG